MLEIYIISSLHNYKRVLQLQTKLSYHHIGVAYNWACHAEDAINGTQDKSHYNLNRIAKEEIKGVSRADIILLVMPARLGSHFELGIAYQLQKPIVYLDDTDTEENAKWLEPLHHMNDIYYSSKESDALARIVMYNNYGTLYPKEQYKD